MTAKPARRPANSCRWYKKGTDTLVELTVKATDEVQGGGQWLQFIDPRDIRVTGLVQGGVISAAPGVTSAAIRQCDNAEKEKGQVGR